MGIIVAIGGGELRQGETEKIDRYIVGLSKKDAPRLLFIPTASYDAEGYIELVKEKYGQLGCIVDTLCLYTEKYNDEQIRDKILDSDIIYVGAGDTVRMMEKWKAHKVDVYLKEAYKEGIVMTGLSAGSICWFVFGHSDSNFFTNQNQWEFTRAYGLGLILAAHCPHYNEEGRESFDEMMRSESIPGIALENNTALVEIDGTYRIIKADEKRKAYILRSYSNCLQKEELPEGEFQLISNIPR